MTSACAAGLLCWAVLAAQTARSAQQLDCQRYEEYLHVVGHANTPGDAFGVAVQGGYAYVADGPTGLVVVDVATPNG